MCAIAGGSGVGLRCVGVVSLSMGKYNVVVGYEHRLTAKTLIRIGQCGRAAAGCGRAAAAFCAASTMLGSALLAI
jgi:hypothetical protein